MEILKLKKRMTNGRVVYFSKLPNGGEIAIIPGVDTAGSPAIGLSACFYPKQERQAGRVKKRKV